MCPTSRTSTRILRAPYSPLASPCSPPSLALHPPRWCCPGSGSPVGVSGSSFGAPTVWSCPSPASASAASRMKGPSPWLSPSRTWIPARARTRICRTQTPPAHCPGVQTAPVCESAQRADPFLWTGSSGTAGTWRETPRNPEIMYCLWRKDKFTSHAFTPFFNFLLLQTHPRGCSARTGTGFLLSGTLSGSDQSSYSGPQTATAFGFPGESRHIFGTSHFYLWRTSWTEGCWCRPCCPIDVWNSLWIKRKNRDVFTAVVPDRGGSLFKIRFSIQTLFYPNTRFLDKELQLSHKHEQGCTICQYIVVEIWDCI